MKPDDLTLHPFEWKIAEAAKLRGVTDLTPKEAATVKDRIRFILFDSNPAALSVAQIGDWLDRVLPSIRSAAAKLESHNKLENGRTISASNVLPPAYQPEGAVEADSEVLAAGEVLCSIVGDRKIRFNPSTMVVTPLKVESR